MTARPSVLTRTSRMFLGGPTGLGKTHVALSMAAGIASGEGFLHWRGSAPGGVLYVDGEMPRELMQERIRDLYRRMPDSNLDGLFVLNWEDGETLGKIDPALGELPPLNTEAGHNFIHRTLELLGDVCAVIFDNRMSLLSGDMKEEQPWTDTMPLVKELSRRRIAQIWIDHTGHDTGHIYGSKTKEWSFDAVALLEAIERPGTDIAARLRFTKARRRKPSNRVDFEPATLILSDDQWSSETTTPSTGQRKAPPAAMAAAKVLQDAIGLMGEPLPVGADWPSNTHGIRTERWFAECDSRGVSLAKKPDDRRRAIERAMTQARVSGLVSVREPFCWLVSELRP